MPELRQNLATKEWVLLATERARRPEDFAEPAKPAIPSAPYVATCPFCPGNEEHDLTVATYPETGPWSVRVVRNKFPALTPESPDPVPLFDGLTRVMPGFGHHEVVVESPRHDHWPVHQDPARLRMVLQAFADRGRTWAEDPRVAHAVWFKNHGQRAGTSLKHPHAQLMALPIVPNPVRARLLEARHYRDERGTCAYCDMLAAELESGDRIVVASEHVVAFVPYAALSPFHLWIVPRAHAASFVEANSAVLDDLAAVLWEVMARLHVGLNDPDFNYVVRSAPLRHREDCAFHWYVAVVPRVTRAAGFELGSGMFINTARPADSAAFLRAVALSSD